MTSTQGVHSNGLDERHDPGGGFPPAALLKSSSLAMLLAYVSLVIAAQALASEIEAASMPYVN